MFGGSQAFFSTGLYGAFAHMGMCVAVVHTPACVSGMCQHTHASAREHGCPMHCVHAPVQGLCGCACMLLLHSRVWMCVHTHIHSHMCPCVCVHTCMYVSCVHAHACLYVCTCVWVRASACARVHTCIRGVCPCTCAHVCACLCTGARATLSVSPCVSGHTREHCAQPGGLCSS